MKRLVMKFGGTSVADMDCLHRVARHVEREVCAGYEVIVVLSAMAGHTDRLVRWTRSASTLHDAREYDVIVSSGEQVTVGLLSIILQSMGISARSWLGWQVPIHTGSTHGAARIVTIGCSEIEPRLVRGEVAVIAGFQGLGPDNRITTLGRGGSDASAVALSSAFGARCDIYTDVDGIYTADPTIVDKAQKLDKIAYEEMLEMASLGARVLQTRSVELAMTHGVSLRVLSSFDEDDLSINKGTILCDEDDIVEHQIVRGITHLENEAKVSLLRVLDRPGVSAKIFGPLSDANINVDMIVQNVSSDGLHANLTFTVSANDLDRALEVLSSHASAIGYEDLKGSVGVSKISVVGIGMRSHAGVAARVFSVLAEKGINIQAITTSEIKISILIDSAYTELACRSLHSAF